MHDDIVILEGDDPFRACSQADSASPAAVGIRQWSALFILIQGPKWTFFGAALALGASLHEEIEFGEISGTRMNRFAF